MEDEKKERQRKMVREAHARSRALLKEKGTCVDCALYPADPPHVLCKGCRHDRRVRAQRRKLRVAAVAAWHSLPIHIFCRAVL